MSKIFSITSKKDNISLFRRLNIYIALLLSSILKACNFPSLTIPINEQHFKENKMWKEIDQANAKVPDGSNSADTRDHTNPSWRDYADTSWLDNWQQDNIKKELNEIFLKMENAGSALESTLSKNKDVDFITKIINSQQDLTRAKNVVMNSLDELTQDKSIILEEKIVSIYLSKEFNVEKSVIDEKLKHVYQVNNFKNFIDDTQTKSLDKDDVILGLASFWLGLNKDAIEKIKLELVNQVEKLDKWEKENIEGTKYKNDLPLLKHFMSILDKLGEQEKFKFFLDIIVGSKELLESSQEYYISKNKKLNDISDLRSNISSSKDKEQKRDLIYNFKKAAADYKGIIEKYQYFLKSNMFTTFEGVITPLVKSNKEELFKLIRNDKSYEKYCYHDYNADGLFVEYKGAVHAKMINMASTMDEEITQIQGEVDRYFAEISGQVENTD